jgi:hypothetical protein
MLNVDPVTLREFEEMVMNCWASLMEKEMCHYLECDLNVDPVTLREFEEMVMNGWASSECYKYNYIFMHISHQPIST